MDFGALRTLVRDLNFSAHGVPATVTPPGEAAVETRGIWLTPVTEQFGMDLRRSEPKRIMALKRDEVPSVPRGTLIVAPEQAGGADQTWRVEATDRLEADKRHVIVVPEP